MLDTTTRGTPTAPFRPQSAPARAGADDRAATVRGEQRDQESGHTTLRAVVALASQNMERCALASGILIGHGDVELAEASEPLATELDQPQRHLEAGPGPQACTTSSIVSSDDLRTDPRWPSLGPVARRSGIAAAIAVPLLPERESPGWFGWLTLYSRDPGPCPPASVALAQTLGLYCSSTVNSGIHARNLESALASRDLIGQAKGIIMARRNVDDEQAFAILRQASQHANRRLRDVAETVVRSCGRQGIGEPGDR